MSKPKTKTFTVSVDIKVATTVDIKAASFEDALEEARKLGVRDVVEFEGDFMDGSIDVSGIWNG